jgi:hypothetical protein
MTGESAFTPEEWARLLRAPFVTGMAVMAAEPGGSIDTMKESMATLTATTEIARFGGRGELVDELARSIAIEITGGKELAELQPGIETPAGEMLAEVRAVNSIVRAKATPQEADAFRDWLLETALRTAQAAKEGGFLGIGSKRVGKGEQEILDALRAALA